MLRDNLVGLIEPMPISAGVEPLALSIQKQASDDRSSCLENPRPEGAESSLTENVTSPLQAEPAHEDAVLDYPQSGERTRGRSNIQNQRASQPSKKPFTVRRIIGCSDLWITEFILTYDGKPSYTVGIMEFRDHKVARETQYFADPFVAPAWRAQWVERMDT